jgi:ElaB/YqjD/DUF883 family membrane-anchored ribosome-binding protein
METHFPNVESSETRVAFDRVLGDLRTLARDAEELLNATAGDASETASAARARLTAALEKAWGTCTELQDHGFTAAKAAARKADDAIRTRPYESIGIAFGVGMLLGALLKRK